jgi:hypothetical protein
MDGYYPEKKNEVWKHLTTLVKVLGETFSMKERKSRAQSIRFTNIILWKKYL